MPRYEALYRMAYPERRESDPIKARVAALRAEHGIADRRRRRLEPPPAPEQLTLTM